MLEKTAEDHPCGGACAAMALRCSISAFHPSCGQPQLLTWCALMWPRDVFKPTETAQHTACQHSNHNQQVMEGRTPAAQAVFNWV